MRAYCTILYYKEFAKNMGDPVTFYLFDLYRMTVQLKKWLQDRTFGKIQQAYDSAKMKINENLLQ